MPAMPTPIPILDRLEVARVVIAVDAAALEVEIETEAVEVAMVTETEVVEIEAIEETEATNVKTEIKASQTTRP